MKTKWLLFLCFFFWASSIFAEPLVLKDGQGEYSLGQYLQILEDPSGQLTLNDVISPEFSQKFVPSDTDVPNFGFTDSAYWVRFEVENLANSQDWLLEIDRRQLQVELYVLKASGAFEMKQASSLRPFDERELRNRNFIFQLPALSSQPSQIYLKVRGVNDLTVPLKIWSNQAFLEQVQQQQYALGIYYGIMGVMVIYNLFLFVSIRHRSYLFYVFYIFNYIMFQLSADGFAYEYLWPHSPQWNARGWGFFIILTLFWAVMFAQNFLQMAIHTPLLNKIFFGALFLLLASMFAILLPNYQIALQATMLLVTPLVLMFILAAILCWKRGYRPARYYLWGWSVLIAIAIATSLASLGVLPSLFLTEYGLHIGSALEVLLLSFALTDRLNLLAQEKAIAQQKKMKSQREILEKAREHQELEKMLAQQKVVEQEKEYQDLVENFNIGVLRFHYDAVGRLQKANAAALKIFGREEEETSNDLTHIHVFELYQNPRDHLPVIKMLQEGKDCKNQELPAKRRDGSLFWVSLSAKARWHDGKIQWIDAIIEDITHRKESEEKIRRLSNTFEKFVPQQFLKRIASEGIDHIELGKAQTESLSILFADIRAFTELSESTSPQEVLDFLNSYLAEMNQPIQNCHGFIDKFIGDGIMALFDRPTHSTDSFRSSVAMTQAIQSFNEERTKENLPPISIGIAIHSGNAIIGTVGTQERMDSTVLGDTVNLAARMESLTKYYNAQIIISSDTHEDIEDKSLLCRELDFIAVKGKQIPKTIFEVFNGNEASILEKKQKILVPYAEGLSRYRERHWKEAIGLFEECLSIYPEDVVSQIYIERCHQFQKTPPDAHWRGETKMH